MLEQLLIFGLVTIVVVAIIAIVIYHYEQPNGASFNPSTISSQLELTSPWYWVTKAGVAATAVNFLSPEMVLATFPEGIYTLDIAYGQITGGTFQGEPIAGRDLIAFALVGSAPLGGPCGPYVFSSPSARRAPFVSMSALQNCGQPGSLCHQVPDREGCIDDDELYAQYVIHGCAGQQNFGLATGSDCRDVGGNLVPPQTATRFYDMCQPGVTPSAISHQVSQTPFCKANISFIRQGTTCLVAPPYTINAAGIYHALGPITFAGCSASVQSPDGWPSQIWRLWFADWNGSTMIGNYNGPFVRVYHRGSGQVLAPQLTIAGAVIPGPPVLVPSDVAPSNGYCWFINPSLRQLVPGPGTPPSIGAVLPQLVYIFNPDILPKTITYEWFVTFPQFALLNINNTATVGPAIVYNSNDNSGPSPTPSELAHANTVMTIPLSLVAMMPNP